MMEISKTLALTELNIIKKGIFSGAYIDFNLALNGIVTYAKAKRVKQDLTGYEDNFLKGIFWVLGKAIQFAKQKVNGCTNDEEFNDIFHILTSAKIVSLEQNYNEADAINLKNIFVALFDSQENVAKVIKLGQWLEKYGLMLDEHNLEKSYSYWNNYHPRMLALVCYFFAGHVFQSAQGFYQLAKLQTASRVPLNANAELKQNSTFAGKIFLTKIAKEINFINSAEIEACRTIKGVILHLEKAEKILGNKSNVDCSFKFELYVTLIAAYYMSGLNSIDIEQCYNLLCRYKNSILMFESNQAETLSEKVRDMIYEYLKINFNSLDYHDTKNKLKIEINGKKVREIVLELLKDTIDLLNNHEEASIRYAYAEKNISNLINFLHLLPEDYAEWFAKKLWQMFDENKHKILMLELRVEFLANAEKIISADSAANFTDVCIDIMNDIKDIQFNATDNNETYSALQSFSNKIFEKLLNNAKWYRSNADKLRYWSSSLLKLKHDDDKILVLMQIDKLFESSKKYNPIASIFVSQACIDEGFIGEQIKNQDNNSQDSSVFNVIYYLLKSLKDTPDSSKKENSISEVVEFAIKLFKEVISYANQMMKDAYKVNDIYNLIYQYTGWFIGLVWNKGDSSKQRLFEFFLNCVAFEKNHRKVIDLDLCKIQIDNLINISQYIDESMYSYLLQECKLDCYAFLQQYVQTIFEYAKTQNLSNDYLDKRINFALQTLQEQDFNLMAKNAGYAFKHKQLDYYLSLYQQKKLYLTPSVKLSLQQEKAEYLFKASYAYIDYRLNELFNKLCDLKLAADQRFSHYVTIICKALSIIVINDASAIKELDYLSGEFEVLASLESYRSEILAKHLTAFKDLLDKLHTLNSNSLKKTHALGEMGEEIKDKLEAENQQMNLLINIINQIVEDPTIIIHITQNEELMQLPDFAAYINQATKISQLGTGDDAKRNSALLRASSIIFRGPQSLSLSKPEEATADSNTNNENPQIEESTVTDYNQNAELELPPPPPPLAQFGK